MRLKEERKKRMKWRGKEGMRGASKETKRDEGDKWKKKNSEGSTKAGRSYSCELLLFITFYYLIIIKLVIINSFNLLQCHHYISWHNWVPDNSVKLWNLLNKKAAKIINPWGHISWDLWVLWVGFKLLFEMLANMYF